MKVDLNDVTSAPAEVHAHHTGWAWDPDGEVFVLTCHREDDSLLAVVCYTYENWMDTFDRLLQVKKTIDGHDPTINN